jgi:enterochelin esterase family protein
MRHGEAFPDRPAITLPIPEFAVLRHNARMRFLASLCVLAALAVGLSAQAPTAPRLISPDVGADRSVTFRFAAPNAKDVSLALEGAERQPMQRDANGVWTITTKPLDPDLYGYSIVVDGVRMLDPMNHATKPNLLFLASLVHVPGPPSLPWEVGDTPRGTLRRHFYRSKVVGDDREYFVYTPPGYDTSGTRQYPVLYLLHGYSDDASAWTSVGKAHVILDNLIARGAARPMLIVMPLGYGAPEIVAPAAVGIRDNALRRRSYEKFRDALFSEVMPQVEQSYRVAKERGGRAIAGLSMGGAESLFGGLNAIDRFAWIGAFSSGGLDENFDTTFPGLDAAKANGQLRLLWIACGTDDRLIETNRKLRQWLKAKQVRHAEVETPGAHTWMVWRRNLAAFVPLLFQQS